MTAERAVMADLITLLAFRVVAMNTMADDLGKNAAVSGLHPSAATLRDMGRRARVVALKLQARTGA